MGCLLVIIIFGIIVLSPFWLFALTLPLVSKQAKRERGELEDDVHTPNPSTGR